MPKSKAKAMRDKLPLLNVTSHSNEVPNLTSKAVNGLQNLSFRTMHGPELAHIDAQSLDMVNAYHRTIQKKGNQMIVNNTK